MYLAVPPSLQKIILLKFAARACNETEIKSLIERRGTLLDDRAIDKIKETVATFNLPGILHNKLFRLMKPVMIEVTSWIFYIRHIHDEVVNVTVTSCSCLDATDLHENLHWQTVGLIDKHLTSLGLIRNERLDPAFRFVLACNCCSEADILRLWWILSKQVRQRISSLGFLPIVKYWTHRLSKAKAHSKFIPMPAFPYQFQFEYSRSYMADMFAFYGTLPYEVRNYLFGTYGRGNDILKKVSRHLSGQEIDKRVTLGLVNVDNVAALKYFLQSFEPMKKSIFLEVVARNHFIRNELLVYCLSEMRDDQVTMLFKSGRGGRMLSCLVNSPWQESLQSFMNYNSEDITMTDVIELLDYINCFKMKDERWQDYDYESEAAEILSFL